MNDLSTLKYGEISIIINRYTGKNVNYNTAITVIFFKIGLNAKIIYSVY